MKTARILLLSILGSCLVAYMFVENDATYEGTYLSTDGVTPLFTLSKKGKGAVHQMTAGLTTGSIRWRYSTESNSLEIEQGEKIINVLLVGHAKEQGLPIQGKENDLLYLKISGAVTNFQHIASRFDTDSLQISKQAASIR